VAQAHALVALEPRERAAHNIADLDRRAPRARRFVTREHEQRFGVAAHARCEVVEPEEVFEGLGVGLLVLELGDELELAGQQVLVCGGRG